MTSRNSLLGTGAAEQHGGRSLQGDVTRGEGAHLDVLRGRAHPGVRSDVARAEADAELIVIGHVDPGPQERQPLDAKLHQVDAVDDGVACQRQQLERKVVRFVVTWYVAVTSAPANRIVSLSPASDTAEAGRHCPPRYCGDFEFTIGFLRADRHLPASIDAGHRHRRGGPGVLGARGLGSSGSSPIHRRQSPAAGPAFGEPLGRSPGPRRREGLRASRTCKSRRREIASSRRSSQ